MITAPSNVRIKASSEIDNKEDIPGDFEKKLSDPEAYARWVKGINKNMDWIQIDEAGGLPWYQYTKNAFPLNYFFDSKPLLTFNLRISDKYKNSPFTCFQ